MGEEEPLLEAQPQILGKALITEDGQSLADADTAIIEDTNSPYSEEKGEEKEIERGDSAPLIKVKSAILAAAAMKQQLEDVKLNVEDQPPQAKKKKDKRSHEERIQHLESELNQAKAELQAYTDRDANVQNMLASVHVKFKQLVGLGVFREKMLQEEEEEEEVHHGQTAAFGGRLSGFKPGKTWPLYDTSALSQSMAEEFRAMKDYLDAQQLKRDQWEALKKRGRWAAFREWRSHPENSHMLEDGIMGFFIVFNALFMGLQADLAGDPPSRVWDIGDSFFSFLFLFELTYNLVNHGPRKHFCGSSWKMNIFDAIVVTVDVTQLVMLLINPNLTLVKASLLRVLRLFRLAKIIRLFEAEVFDKLLTMIRCLFAGFPTLGWSMVLFFVMLYVFSLTFPALLDGFDDENVTPYFSGLARSLFTMFKCSLGDCSNKFGGTIFVHVYEKFSGFVVFIYCCFVFMVTIGLLNVISAIFVEATMKGGAEIEAEKKDARLGDIGLWYRSLHILIKYLQSHESSQIPADFVEQAETVTRMGIPVWVLQDILKEKEVQDALEDLDIYRDEHEFLGDILDPSNDGIIVLCEMVEGLQLLRGSARRSDIITVDLMVRALQDDLLALHTEAGKLERHVKQLS
eukprot:TRINITY_DN8180_c0_g1_i1.p1 TRINITY_DN8180_c0_g1~~TRINITY_DN8180_c0_g1_i1.p1  ORF type:complete len:629 (+),score=118.77 TRINITY_DN8180_c0_g1_i1:143-2029(+)